MSQPDPQEFVSPAMEAGDAKRLFLGCTVIAILALAILACVANAVMAYQGALR